MSRYSPSLRIPGSLRGINVLIVVNRLCKLSSRQRSMNLSPLRRRVGPTRPAALERVPMTTCAPVAFVNRLAPRRLSLRVDPRSKQCFVQCRSAGSLEPVPSLRGTRGPVSQALVRESKRSPVFDACCPLLAYAPPHHALVGPTCSICLVFRKSNSIVCRTIAKNGKSDSQDAICHGWRAWKCVFRAINHTGPVG